MKKKYISLVFSIFAIICQVMVGAFGAGNVSALDTENFYFDDFTADYYLSQDEEGISHLKVVENFTTIFPDYNQNKGICREIPFTNYGGVNVTLPALTRYNMKLLRNGLSEPIYSIEKYSDYYEVCTGDDDYVKGKQVYTFEYEFEKVVTDFGDYQELYWDTNGNGWTQKFNSVTAKLHFVGDDVKSSFTGDSWCYVGSYGEKGSERCKITKTSDGVEFTASNLRKHENLTFDVELKPGAFAVPEPEKSYIFIYLLLIVAVVAALMLISPIKKYVESRKLANFYKGLFETPEYQPHPKYSLTELTELYFGRKKDSKVGILLDLVIRGKVKIVKGESGLLGGHKWQVEVVNLDDVDKEGLIVLAILKGGDDPSVGDSITVRRRSSDSTLIRLRKKFENTVLANLKSHGLVDSKYKIGGRESISTSIAVWIVCFITFGWIALPIIFVFMEFVTSGNGIVGKVPVGREVAVPAMIVIIITTIIVRSILKRSAKKYVGYTEEGLKAARYMDGLKLYIEMAEADRIKFLQSVENADTSPDGVVHLYEKLLPYAAVLGLEKSWMGELEKYYKIEGVESSSWYNSGVSVTDVVYVSTLASRYMNYSTTVQSSGGGISGGGGSSSGFSGGGGGGFSGGGGGGGGGHGR